MASRAAISHGPCGRKLKLEITLRAGAMGEARSAGTEGAEARAAKTDIERRAADEPLMEAIVERDNLRKALAQVKRNKGAAGIDGMTVDELGPYLKEHWPTIRVQLLEGTYKPQPVRRVEIPKASGGKRPLGIPTVLDRFVQQAVMQVLLADWTERSARRDSASGRAARRIRPWRGHRRISLPVTGSWSTSIWRSSSTGSITTS